MVDDISVVVVELNTDDSYQLAPAVPKSASQKTPIAEPFSPITGNTEITDRKIQDPKRQSALC
jgi:hypothetical protein